MVSYGLYLLLNLHSIAHAPTVTTLLSRGNVYWIRQSGLEAQPSRPAYILSVRKRKSRYTTVLSRSFPRTYSQ